MITQWSTNDLLRGSRSGETKEHVFEILVENHLQRMGVQGGNNELTLIVEQLDSAVLSRVDIGSGTGVFRTKVTPKPVQVLVRSDAIKAVEAGEPARIPLSIVNRGAYPVVDCRVAASSEQKALQVVGVSPSGKFELVRRLAGTCTVLAKNPGHYSLVIAVLNDRNTAAVRISFYASPSHSALTKAIWALVEPPWLLLPVAIAVAALGMYWFLVRRQSRSRGI